MKKDALIVAGFVAVILLFVEFVILPRYTNDYCKTVQVYNGAPQEETMEDMTLTFLGGGPQLENKDQSLRVWLDASQLPEGAEEGDRFTFTVLYSTYGYACAEGGYNNVTVDQITFH